VVVEEEEECCMEERWGAVALTKELVVRAQFAAVAAAAALV